MKKLGVFKLFSYLEIFFYFVLMQQITNRGFIPLYSKQWQIYIGTVSMPIFCLLSSSNFSKLPIKQFIQRPEYSIYGTRLKIFEA